MEFDEFLKEATALLGLQWRPFDRKGIKRKVERRVAEIGLFDFEEYLLKVEKDSEEQSVLFRSFQKRKFTRGSANRRSKG
jgi:chemotaxis methyl-accepting protein methylase